MSELGLRETDPQKMDYALAWHGLIPERVVEVTSICTVRSRVMENALGRFITDAESLAIWSRDYFLDLAQRVRFLR